VSETLSRHLYPTFRPGDPVNLLCEGKYFSGLITAFEYVPAPGSETCGDVHFWKVKANNVRLFPLEEVFILKSPY
jgi:hypothetical protein